MYTIKRDYNEETKQILKRLNGGMFNRFSRLDIDLKNNQIILNDIDNTVINYNYEMTVQELIHANYGSIKSLYLIADDVMENMVNEFAEGIAEYLEIKFDEGEKISSSTIDKECYEAVADIKADIFDKVVKILEGDNRIIK